MTGPRFAYSWVCTGCGHTETGEFTVAAVVTTDPVDEVDRLHPTCPTCGPGAVDRAALPVLRSTRAGKARRRAQEARTVTTLRFRPGATPPAAPARAPLDQAEILDVLRAVAPPDPLGSE